MANEVPYGFLNLKDIFPTTVAEKMPVVNQAIADTLAEHNRQVGSAFAIFVERTIDRASRFKTATLARLQPADEYARPNITKIGSYYDMAWPLIKGQAGFGRTYEAAAKMTVADAAAEIAAVGRGGVVGPHVQPDRIAAKIGQGEITGPRQAAQGEIPNAGSKR